MISVLIPLFNRDINVLVQTLSRQAAALPGPAEIIVMDDGSETRFLEGNRGIAVLPFVRYIKTGKNHGRIRIRRLLADAATFEWLVFLDCDSTILSDQFLSLYHSHVFAGPDVVVAGRVYSHVRPEECTWRLHWKYGSARETGISNVDGQTRPRFMTNNFLIRKKLFVAFHFHEALTGYGYEDTWMGMQLQEMEAVIIYIDNPVRHDGLETSATFIAKSENALRNLLVLSRAGPPALVGKHVKLYSCFRHLQALGLLWVVSMLFPAIRALVLKNLLSCKPSLFLFDLYRLHYFIALHENER